MLELEPLRRTYEKSHLDDEGLPLTPAPLFTKWLKEAIEASPPPLEPNAMTLCTVDSASRPSARTVLLKSFEEGSMSFVFYTNYESRKSLELTSNAHAALLFYWPTLERQVRVEGDAERVTSEESAAYFASRPHASQIGAWASAQSRVVPHRAYLEEQYAMHQSRHPATEPVPCPPFWGGWRVRASRVEFWAGRTSRMHDRIVFHRPDASKLEWSRERLAP